MSRAEAELRQIAENDIKLSQKRAQVRRLSENLLTMMNRRAPQPHEVEDLLEKLLLEGLLRAEQPKVALKRREYEERMASKRQELADLEAHNR